MGDQDLSNEAALGRRGWPVIPLSPALSSSSFFWGGGFYKIQKLWTQLACQCLSRSHSAIKIICADVRSSNDVTTFHRSSAAVYPVVVAVLFGRLACCREGSSGLVMVTLWRCVHVACASTHNHGKSRRKRKTIKRSICHAISKAM